MDPKNINETPNNEKKVFMWNVIAGVVGSVLIVPFVQPILNFIWETLSSTSISVINTMIDMHYKNAALGDRNWVIVGISTIGISIVTFAFVLVLTSRITRSSRPGAMNVSQRNTLTFKVLDSIILRAGLSIGLVILSILLIISMYTDLQLNASFDQRINALSPYVTEQDIKVLRSKWALMGSKSDHKLITKKMDELALKVHIQLPRPLLPD